MQTVVIIPTYNERENICQLINQILTIRTDVRPSARLSNTNESDETTLDLHVLVVDDNSPDGTGEVVEALTRQWPRLHILHRQSKRGYGLACLAGFRWALAHNASIIISMDADYSHDPKYIPEFCRAIEECDMVIGSRYLTGISVVNWPLRRLLLSLFANRYIRFLIGIPVTDCTSGFRAYTAKALKRILPEKTAISGYALLVETLFYAVRRELHIREIPIIFTERQRGQSKMSWRIIWESIWLPWRLKFRWKET